MRCQSVRLEASGRVLVEQANPRPSCDDVSAPSATVSLLHAKSRKGDEAEICPRACRRRCFQALHKLSLVLLLLLLPSGSSPPAKQANSPSRSFTDAQSATSICTPADDFAPTPPDTGLLLPQPPSFQPARLVRWHRDPFLSRCCINPRLLPLLSVVSLLAHDDTTQSADAAGP